MTEDHLLVAKHAQRARNMSVPMPPPEELPAFEFLTGPLLELADTTRGRAALEAEAPSVLKTETVSVPAGMSLYDLAALGSISVAQLRSVGEALETQNRT